MMRLQTLTEIALLQLVQVECARGPRTAVDLAATLGLPAGKIAALLACLETDRQDQDQQEGVVHTKIVGDVRFYYMTRQTLDAREEAQASRQIADASKENQERQRASLGIRDDAKSAKRRRPQMMTRQQQDARQHQQELRRLDDQIRMLKLLKMYKRDGKLQQLVALTERWRDACVESAEQLLHHVKQSHQQQEDGMTYRKLFGALGLDVEQLFTEYTDEDDELV